MRSTYDIYKTIREEIIRGGLNPGERLVEKEWCERLETSRGYLREALKLLGNDGFVILSPGKGATVAKISYQETKDLYQLLAALETKSVELAAPQMTTADFNVLLEINNKLKAYISVEKRINTMKVWQEGNFEFHRYFSERSGNRELTELVENIRWRTFDFRYEYFFEPYYEVFVNQHALLISTMQERNFAKAKIIMEDHINEASEVFLKAWSEFRLSIHPTIGTPHRLANRLNT